MQVAGQGQGQAGPVFMSVHDSRMAKKLSTEGIPERREAWLKVQREKAKAKRDAEPPAEKRARMDRANARARELRAGKNETKRLDAERNLKKKATVNRDNEKVRAPLDRQAMKVKGLIAAVDAGNAAWAARLKSQNPPAGEAEIESQDYTEGEAETTDVDSEETENEADEWDLGELGDLFPEEYMGDPWLQKMAVEMGWS